MAFNVGLYLVMAYTMLEAADALIVGDLMVAAAATFIQNTSLFGHVIQSALTFIIGISSNKPRKQGQKSLSLIPMHRKQPKRQTGILHLNQEQMVP